MKTWTSVLLLTGGVLVLMLGTPLVCLGQDAELLQRARSGDGVHDSKIELRDRVPEGRGVAQDDTEAAGPVDLPDDLGKKLPQAPPRVAPPSDASDHLYY